MAHGPGDDSHLRKGLKQRHLAMIAIGGVIGAGLFVGSGAIIGEVGPGAFLTYALTGVLILMVMRGKRATPMKACESAQQAALAGSQRQVAQTREA